MDPASPASSDNDPQDEVMDDIDADAEPEDDGSDEDKDTDVDDDDNADDMDDMDVDADGDGENDVDADGDGEDNDDGPGHESDGRAPPHHKSASPPPARPIPTLRPEAKMATTYDIVPYVAAPHSTSINAFCATPCMRWIFTGGSDGYIRKFDWFQSINGKVPLTVAQKHPFVDSVTRAGVLLSYWENEEPAAAVKSQYLHIEGMTDDLKLSPVYSLAVQNQALWLLSGLESGGINLQSCRHDEGKIITCLRKHTSAVSVLTLAHDERSVLSGGWDKAVYDWDLNTGQVAREFLGSAGQISSIAWRPNGPDTISIPKEAIMINGVSGGSKGFTSGVNGSVTLNGINGTSGGSIHGIDQPAQAASPADSSRSYNSLFENDDEFSAAVAANGMGNQNNLGEEDIENEEARRDEFDNNPTMNGEAGEGADGITIGNSVLFRDDFGGNATVNGTTSQDVPSSVVDPSTLETSNHQTSSDDHGPYSFAAQNSNSFSTASSSSFRDQTVSQTNHQSGSATSPLPSSPASLSSPSTNVNSNVFLTSSIDGTLRLWDTRQQSLVSVSTPAKGIPPWAMNACWSIDGNFVYVGRRNGTVEEYSIHKGINTVNRTLKLPAGSGLVSALWAMPNGRHLMCASFDNLRLYDLQAQTRPPTKHSAVVPFLIVPGHHGGVVSQLHVDPTCTFVISTGGNRGWEGGYTEVLLGYEVGCVQ